MEVSFPDIPEYHFILKGLCGNIFTSYPKFQCEPLLDFEENIEADIVFAPAPVAMLNSHSYVIMRSGSIFSYFSGPSIFSIEGRFNELYVREKDFISYYYARLFLKNVRILKGNGFPAIIEPRLCLLNLNTQYRKEDLYGRWSIVAGNLPFPLYVGLIKNELKDSKEIVENAINSSIKYSLENFSAIIKDLAAISHTENVEMLKRTVLHFVNKHTMRMGMDEADALIALKNEMENSGFPVAELVF